MSTSAEGPRPGRAEAAAVAWTPREVDGSAARATAARKKALMHAAGAASAGGLLFVVFAQRAVAYVAWGLGGFTLLLALISPLGAYAALQRGLEALGRLVGRLMAWLLLAPVFYLFVTPFGLLRRRGARDTLKRRLEPGAASYWRERPEDERVTTLEKPF